LLKFFAKLFGAAPKTYGGPGLRMPLNITPGSRSGPKAQPNRKPQAPTASSSPPPSSAAAVMEPEAPDKPKTLAPAKPNRSRLVPSISPTRSSEPSEKSTEKPAEGSIADTVQDVLQENKQRGNRRRGTKTVTKKQTGGAFELCPSTDPSKKVCIFEAVLFELPVGWVVEYVPSLNGILIFCTDMKATWAANMYFEFREEVLGRSIEQCLADIEERRSAEKEDFEKIYAEDREHHNGFHYGILEYRSKDREGTLLVEWEIVIPYHDHLHLCITAASSKADWDRNHPHFHDVIYSIAPQSNG